MAPMDGVTDCRYRNAWMEVFGRKSKMHKAVSPFVTLVRGDRVKLSHLSDLLPENNRKEWSLEPQFLGNETELFPTMVRALADLGYRSVNWNLGCPMRQVASKQRGSGLLPHPDRIAFFLESAFSVSPLPISVKIRLGYSRPEEVYGVLEVLNAYPLLYVAVHPRTGIQMYGGKADWDWLEKILPSLRHPCVYSGDVDSREKAEALLRRFPRLEGVMLGRGVIADPFLPCVLSGTSFAEEEKKIYFARFLAALLRNYGNGGFPESLVLQRQKLFWSRFRGGFVPEGGFDRVKRMTDISAYGRYCRDVFGENFG